VIFVSLAWLLFRLPDFSQVRIYIAALFSNWRSLQGGETMLTLVLFSLPVVIYHLVHLVPVGTFGTATRNWILGALLAMIILNKGTAGAFIYFQF
jgi:alginate O-acetyltransferase complex protein AlgI